MSNGVLGASDLSAATDTIVYSVPTDTFAVITINVVNRGASTCTIRIALATANTPNNSEYIEYEAQVLPGGVLERTGVVVEADRNVIVRSSAANAGAMVYGLETATA
jgi:hypothetical protein